MRLKSRSASATATRLGTLGSALAVVAVAMVSPVLANERMQEVPIGTGGCVIVQTIATSDTDPKVVELRCNQAQTRDASIKYLELDAYQSSLLLLGYADETLATLIGRRPAVSNNEVFRRLEGLYAEFGTLSGPDNYLANTTMIANDPDYNSVGFSTLDDIPEAIRNRIRYPTFHGQLIWPDPSASHTFFETDDWPGGFGYSFRRENDETGETSYRRVDSDLRSSELDPADVIATCVAMARFVSQQEFLGYWARVEELANEMMRTNRGLQDINGYEPGGWRGVEATEFMYQNAPSAVYDLIAEVTSAGFPDDFLVLTGTITNGEREGGGCWQPGGGLNLYAFPRSLKTIVAVVSPVGEAVTVVDGAEVQVDTDISLRSDPQYGQAQSVTTGQIVLSRDQGTTYVIPLRIEFQYEPDTLPFLTTSTAIPFGRASELVEHYASTQLDFWLCDGPCELATSKRLGDLPVSPLIEPTPNYVYGEAVQLVSVNAGGERIEAAAVPRIDLYTTWGEDGASCPFAYFEMADGSLRYHGRVLVGANDPTLQRNEVVRVPEGAVRFILREEEPEITYVEALSFLTAGGATLASSREAMVLAPRDAVSVKIPTGAAFVELAGYYLPLDGEPLDGPTAISRRPAAK